jgi:hypothetical protein
MAEDDVLEYNCEYLGGHVKFPDKGSVILQLGEEEIYVAAYTPSTIILPFLAIPYKDITGVQAVPYEKISTLRTFAFGSLVGLMWRKNEHLLTLAFKDELGMEQTVAFKIKKTDKVHEEIYDRAVTARKKK